MALPGDRHHRPGLALCRLLVVSQILALCRLLMVSEILALCRLLVVSEILGLCRLLVVSEILALCRLLVVSQILTLCRLLVVSEILGLYHPQDTYIHCTPHLHPSPPSNTPPLHPILTQNHTHNDSH